MCFFFMILINLYYLKRGSNSHNFDVRLEKFNFTAFWNDNFQNWGGRRGGIEIF